MIEIKLSLTFTSFYNFSPLIFKNPLNLMYLNSVYRNSNQILLLESKTLTSTPSIEMSCKKRKKLQSIVLFLHFFAHMKKYFKRNRMFVQDDVKRIIKNKTGFHSSHEYNSSSSFTLCLRLYTHIECTF